MQRYLENGAPFCYVDPFEDLKRYITESGIALFMMDPSSASKTGELRNLTPSPRAGASSATTWCRYSQMGTFLGTDASVPVAANYPPIDHEGLSS